MFEDYECEGNMTIFDYLDELNRPVEPELSKGTAVYKLILDVVENGVIDHTWELRDKYGYAAKKPIGTFITFWSPDIGDTVFTDKEAAYTKAESLRNTYKVIRGKDMEVIKEINFARSDFKNDIESVKLLKGNMVYFKKWPCYPFLEKFETEKQAEKRYKKCIDEIVNDINNIKKVQTDESLPMQDMYLARTGKWSRYDYVDFNHPVLVTGGTP